MLKGLVGMPGAEGQLGSSIFGPQTSSSSGSSFGTSDTNSSSMPVITEQYQALESMLRKAVEDKLQRGTSLPPGYAESQIRGVNDAFSGQEQALRNRAGQLGIPASQLLTGSPVEMQRASRLSDIAAQLPLLERQLQNEDQNQAQGLTQAFGRGEQSQSHTTNRSQQTGSNTSSANPGGILSYLQMLAPRDRSIVQQPQSGSVLGSALTGAFSGAGLGQQLAGALPQQQSGGIYGGVPDQIFGIDPATGRPYGR